MHVTSNFLFGFKYPLLRSPHKNTIVLVGTIRPQEIRVSRAISRCAEHMRMPLRVVKESNPKTVRRNLPLVSRVSEPAESATKIIDYRLCLFVH